MSISETTGENLRDAGMAAALAHSPQSYKAAFTKAYESLVRARRPFTSEEVVEIVGMPPTHHNVVGALMSGLVGADLKAERISYVAHVKKQRPNGHAAKIGQYVGCVRLENAERPAPSLGDGPFEFED